MSGKQDKCYECNRGDYYWWDGNGVFVLMVIKTLCLFGFSVN